MHDTGVDASKTRFYVEILDFDTTSTRLQGHKLIVYSIIWHEPAEAQTEAWQHHANEIGYPKGPRPSTRPPCVVHEIGMVLPCLSLCFCWLGPDN